MWLGYDQVAIEDIYRYLTHKAIGGGRTLVVMDGGRYVAHGVRLAFLEPMHQRTALVRVKVMRTKAADVAHGVDAIHDARESGPEGESDRDRARVQRASQYSHELMRDATFKVIKNGVLVELQHHTAPLARTAVGHEEQTHPVAPASCAVLALDDAFHERVDERVNDEGNCGSGSTGAQCRKHRRRCSTDAPNC